MYSLKYLASGVTTIKGLCSREGSKAGSTYGHIQNKYNHSPWLMHSPAENKWEDRPAKLYSIPSAGFHSSIADLFKDCILVL